MSAAPNRHVDAAMVHALRLALEPHATAAARTPGELGLIAGDRVWVLEVARARITRGLDARSTPRGERARQLLALCAPLWSSGTGSRITGGPVVSDLHLIVGTEDGRLIAYRPG